MSDIQLISSAGPQYESEEASVTMSEENDECFHCQGPTTSASGKYCERCREWVCIGHWNTVLNRIAYDENDSDLEILYLCSWCTPHYKMDPSGGNIIDFQPTNPLGINYYDILADYEFAYVLIQNKWETTTEIKACIGPEMRFENLSKYGRKKKITDRWLEYILLEERLEAKNRQIYNAMWWSEKPLSVIKVETE